MADEDVNQRLAGIEAALAEMRAEMATKADLAALRAEMKADLAGVAKNVDVRHLGEQVAQMLREGRALRGDVRLLTGIGNAVQALADHHLQLSDRVSALETAPPEEPSL